MLNVCRILVTTAKRAFVLGGVAVTLLAGCGQKGDLFLPTEPAAANRATLTESLRPTIPGAIPAIPTQPVTPATPATPVTSAMPGTPGTATDPASPASAPR